MGVGCLKIEMDPLKLVFYTFKKRPLLFAPSANPDTQSQTWLGRLVIYSKNFFSFEKHFQSGDEIGSVGGGQANNLFFFLPNLKI